MRFRLNDPLVTSFIYKDKEYDIDLSFDNVLDVFEYRDNKYLFDHEKAILCLELLLGENTFDVEESIDLWNHVYKEFIEIESKRPIPKDLKGNPMPINDEVEKRIID